MRCPNCLTQTMSQKQVKQANVRIDQCPQCGGLWFDRDELEKVLDVAAKELNVPSAASPTRRACPRCSSPLYRFNYPQTYCHIDMCRHCGGIWLDRGEFKEIKMVRQHLKEKGELESLAPVTGIKGGLIDFINRAIDGLT